MVAALAAPLGCEPGAGELERQEPPVIRVAAGEELTAAALEPSERNEGSASYMHELLYESASDHLVPVERKDRVVFLDRREGSDRPLDELARSLRFSGLSAATMEGDRIRAELVSAARARALEDSNEAGLDTGDYRVVSQKNRVRLEPIALGRPPIEFVPIGDQDAWRLLAGRHIDVVPDLGSLNARYLEGIASIALNELKTRTFIGLAFNLRSEAMSDRAVRRAVAIAVRDSGVAEVACGTGCGFRLPGAEGANDLPVTVGEPIPRFSVAVLADAPENVLAGHTIAHAIWIHTGTRPRVEKFTLARLTARMRSGDFDALLVPLSEDPYSLYADLLPQGRMGLLGYDDETFAAAVETGDWAAAAAQIEEDAVLVPLWRWRRYAAVDRSICGAEPSTPTSWAWLADLRHCHEGEAP